MASDELVELADVHLEQAASDDEADHAPQDTRRPGGPHPLDLHSGRDTGDGEADRAVREAVRRGARVGSPHGRRGRTRRGAGGRAPAGPRGRAHRKHGGRRPAGQGDRRSLGRGRAGRDPRASSRCSTSSASGHSRARTPGRRPGRCRSGRSELDGKAVPHPFPRPAARRRLRPRHRVPRRPPRGPASSADEYEGLKRGITTAARSRGCATRTRRRPGSCGVYRRLGFAPPPIVARRRSGSSAAASSAGCWRWRRVSSGYRIAVARSRTPRPGRGGRRGPCRGGRLRRRRQPRSAWPPTCAVVTYELEHVGQAGRRHAG